MNKVFFAIALGAYDSGEAVDTLPAQLDYLRTLRDLQRPDVALVYRLQTFAEPQGDLGASFKILCVGRDGDALAAAERESLLDQISVALLPAWGLTHWRTEKPIPRAKCRTRLDPLSLPGTLPIKADWTPLVDLLRRRREPITVDWICSSAAIPTSQSQPALEISPPVLETDQQPVLETDHQLDAAQFFVAAASRVEDHDMHPLSLRVLVHSEYPIDDVLARTIGRATLGMPVVVSPTSRNVLFQQKPDGMITGQPEELIRLFHGPYGRIQGRGLEGSRRTEIPIRFSVPESQGSALGTAVRQGPRGDVSVPVRLSPSDRLKHTYVLGKTGSGKTNFLKHLVKQDIEAGHGVAIIDPHGDLVQYTLKHVTDRLEDVVLLDFGDPEYLPVLNPLVVDVGNEAERDLAVTELLDVIVRRSSSQYTGPVFEDCVRMVLSTVASSRLRDLAPTPTIIAAIELLRSTAGRKWARANMSESELANEWQTFNSMSANDVAEHVRWVTAKFTDFGPEGILRPVTSGADTGLSLRSIIAENKVLLVKLPEAVIGPRAAAFLGSLIFSRLHRAALARGPAPENPFYLHVDEFQKFVSADVEGLVAEARKFGLSLTLAHQNLRQLDAFSRFEGSASSRLREAIFSNVGSLVCMKMSGADVHALAEEMGVSDHKIRQLAQFSSLTRSVVDGIEREPFTLRIPNADTYKGKQRTVERVKKRMVELGYWQLREELNKNAEEVVGSIRSAWKDNGSVPPSVPKTVSIAESFKEKLLKAKSESDKMSKDGAAVSESNGGDPSSGSKLDPKGR